MPKSEHSSLTKQMSLQPHFRLVVLQNKMPIGGYIKATVNSNWRCVQCLGILDYVFPLIKNKLIKENLHLLCQCKINSMYCNAQSWINMHSLSVKVVNFLTFPWTFAITASSSTQMICTHDNCLQQKKRAVTKGILFEE